MIEITPDSFLLKPYEYQYDGIRHIITRQSAAIFDEMGVGKTKQAIDAASILYQNGKINAVVVVSPASVRGVWDNATTGEIEKHCKSDYVVYRYDALFQNSIPVQPNHLIFITISYSFLRARLSQFLALIKQSKLKFMLVLDESSYVKSRVAAQTKACHRLRQFANRCILLNGTPIANHVLDLWAQFNILDPYAIDNMNFFQFRARYAIMGGFKNKQAFGFDEKELTGDIEKLENFKFLPDTPFKAIRVSALERKIDTQEKVRYNIEQLKLKLKPWIIRREKKDVLKDLPDKLPPVYLEAPLSEEAWKMYEDMRDDMVAWADTANYSESINGAVKIGRLSQITSGILGGMQSLDDEIAPTVWRVIDSAKLKTFIEWYDENRELKVLVWCRFREEMKRLSESLKSRGVRVAMLIGGQRDAERQEGIDAFRAGEIDVMIGNPGAGGFGLDGFQTHCYTCVYISLDHSLIKYQQSSDRLHRNGQTMPVSYIFIVGVSPDGKKETIDQRVINAVLNKEDLSQWAMDKWREELRRM